MLDFRQKDYGNDELWVDHGNDELRIDCGYEWKEENVTKQDS